MVLFFQSPLSSCVVSKSLSILLILLYNSTTAGMLLAIHASGLPTLSTVCRVTLGFVAIVLEIGNAVG